MREGNYHCSKIDCDYTTGLINPTEEELDDKLKKDGGYDTKNNTKCPKCKGDSLAYIK